MKTSHSKTDSQPPSGAVLRTQRRVAAAETAWKAAKEQRKEAKLIFRRAKEQAKLAKADLASARKTLTKAVAKVVKSSVRRVTKKPGKSERQRDAKAISGAPGGNPVPALKQHRGFVAPVKPVAVSTQA